MKEYCVHCGAELREGAMFCVKCGLPVANNEPPAAQPAEETVPLKAVHEEQDSAPLTEDVKAGKKKNTSSCKKCSCAGFVQKMRNFTERYLLPGFAFLACLVVFIGGFFINISFMPMEQTQAKLSVDISSGNTDIEGAFSTIAFEQNVFNVFGALGVPFGGNSDEATRIEEALFAQLTNLVDKYYDEIVRVSALDSMGEGERAAVELVQLLDRMAKEFSRSAANINVIKMDRLDAELTYSAALEQTGEGGEVSQQVLKYANDTIARTAIMTGYPVGVIYLQIVSLVFLIMIAVGLIGGKKVSGTKFFVLYLIGFAFLFLIGQLSATTIGGAGMFCFVFASVLFFLYLAARVLSSGKLTTEKGIVALANGAVMALSFAALCVTAFASYEFGGLVDRVGSVFGLYAFGSTMPGNDALSLTVSGILLYGLTYIPLLTLVSLSFFLSAKAVNKGSRGVSAIVLAAVSLLCLWTVYLTLSILSAGGHIDILYAPHALFTSGALLLVAIILFIVRAVVLRKVSRDPAGQLARAPYAGNMPYYQPVQTPYVPYGATDPRRAAPFRAPVAAPMQQQAPVAEPTQSQEPVSKETLEPAAGTESDVKKNETDAQ